MRKSKKNKKKKSRATAVDVNTHFSLEKIETLIKEAETSVDSFNYEEAEAKLQEALQIDSNNCKCLEILSSIYIERFQFIEAEDLLKRCIELSPESGFSKYFSIGQIKQGLESVRYYEKGIQLLEKELENSENIDPSKDQNKNTLIKILSDAYCSVSELFMTDCCFEENAEEMCFAAINKAITIDSSNPEAYQCLANFQLVKEQFEESKESMRKSLSLWLPQIELQEDSVEGTEKESEIRTPLYDSRIKTTKLLIELEMYDEASKILNGLLEEDDEVIEVWYLLGWLNYLKGDEYKESAHFYFKKAKQISIKMGHEDDDCIQHINELLEELSSTHPITDEEADREGNLEDTEHNFCTDSESDEEMET